jgi:predicted small secreted protein
MEAGTLGAEALAACETAVPGVGLDISTSGSIGR